MRKIPMYMKDWIAKLDGFLSLNDRNILMHAGKISHEIAIQHVEKHYEEFNFKRIKKQDELESDFDRSVKIIKEKTKNYQTNPLSSAKVKRDL